MKGGYDLSRAIWVEWPGVTTSHLVARRRGESLPVSRALALDNVPIDQAAKGGIRRATLRPCRVCAQMLVAHIHAGERCPALPTIAEFAKLRADVAEAQGRARVVPRLAPRKTRARPSRPSVELIQVERHLTERFDVLTVETQRRAERREQALVRRYREHLEKRHGLAVRRLRIQTGSAELVCDLYVEKRGQLIEAKGDATRTCIRTAIGQLADYSHFVKRYSGIERLQTAVLLPEHPGQELVELLGSQRIATVWEELDGTFGDSSGGRFT